MPPFLLPVGLNFFPLNNRPLSQSEMRMDDRRFSDQGPGPVWVDLSVIVAQIAAIIAYVFWAMP